MPTPSVYAKQVARIQELELTEERQEEEIQDLTSQLETCARERNDALEACIRLNSELDAARREQREANARSDARSAAETNKYLDLKARCSVLDDSNNRMAVKLSHLQQLVDEAECVLRPNQDVLVLKGA